MAIKNFTIEKANFALKTMKTTASVTIPPGTKIIENKAFQGCSGIVSVKISSSVTSTCNLIEEVEFTKILQMKYADRLAA